MAEIHSSTTLSDGPSAEPITLQEAKVHLHVEDTNDHDTWLDGPVGAIARARRFVERRTGRQLITATWDMFLDRFPDEILVAKPPLRSVATLKYVQSSDGVQTTLASSKYATDTDSEPGRIVPAYNESWPSIRPQNNAVEIRYDAGYGTDGSSVPPDLLQAIYWILGFWFEERSGLIVGVSTSELPRTLGIDALLNGYMVNY